MKDQEKHIVGEGYKLGLSKDGKDVINFDHPKIAYMTERCRGKDVLDLGCVQHESDAYLNKNWLHKAIVNVAKSAVGLDLYHEGVVTLQKQGFNVVHGDAQNYDLGTKFDVVVAGDLIEHLSNFDGFFNSARKHLRPGGKFLIATPNPWHWVRCLTAARGKMVPVNPEHTTWFCPETVRLISGRFGFEAGEVSYGTDRFKDQMIPLPKTFRHQSFYMTLRPKAA
jgi:SAM-dependent methyltransferase